jgi:hypothetical protein
MEALPGVTVYHAKGCHLCERAIEVVREAAGIVPFALELVDIGGDDELEAAYRALLPVVEIDGERAFTYFVSLDALLRRLRRTDGSPDGPESAAGNM